MIPAKATMPESPLNAMKMVSIPYRPWVIGNRVSARARSGAPRTSGNSAHLTVLRQLQISRRMCVLLSESMADPSSDDSFPISRSHASRLVSDYEQMCTAANYCRLRFQGPRDLKENLATLRIFPALIDVGKDPPRTLNSKKSFALEAGVDHLPAQILGPMKICCREIVQSIGRIAMLAVDEIALHDSDKIRVEQQLARETVEGRCEPRYPGGNDHAARPQYSLRFSQGRQSIALFYQVIERPQQQHHIRGLVRLRKLARVRHRTRCQPGGSAPISLTRHIHQSRRQIKQSHFVTTLGEPERIDTGRSPDVENHGRWRRRVAENQLSSPRLLEARHTVLEAGFFGRVIVIGLDRWIDARGRSPVQLNDAMSMTKR